MKIVHISDTHGNHAKLNLPKGDVLIHSGDFSAEHSNYKEETQSFLDWFKKQDFQEKILISGNWDKNLGECEGFERLEFNFDGITYLNNQAITIDGLKIYGSPWTPSDFGSPFTYYPEDADWNHIPSDTDILVTHGPAKGILDDEHGCPALKNKIDTLDVKAHLFGHIHQSKGMKEIGGTVFSNAAETVNAFNIS